MIWTAIVGIALGLLLVHGESQKVREAKAKARRRKRTITHQDGLTLDLEEVILIEDLEEELEE